LSEKKLRLSVIGLGKMGLLHASLLNVLPEVELVACCEKSALMNRLFRKVFSRSGILVVNDLEKLQELNLDAVYVTTPISSHSPIIKNLWAKEICRSIFVEKTLSSDFPQSKELCDLAKKEGGTVMVGYMKRFSVVFGKAKQLLSQGALGEPQRFKAYAYSSDFLGLNKESTSSASRGGALSDLGCHVIDLALWLLGPLNVNEIFSCVKNEAGSETSVSFEVSNSMGLVGEIAVSQSMPNYRMPEFGLSIDCSKGTIQVNDDRLTLSSSSDQVEKKFFRHDLNDNVLFSMGEAEYFRENQHFVNSVLSGHECESSFDSASKVDFMIQQVRAKSVPQ
jgi:scyllo-inositol 2-dehydrogenase (NADP+)